MVFPACAGLNRASLVLGRSFESGVPRPCGDEPQSVFLPFCLARF